MPFSPPSPDDVVSEGFTPPSEDDILPSPMESMAMNVGTPPANAPTKNYSTLGGEKTTVEPASAKGVGVWDALNTPVTRYFDTSVHDLRQKAMSEPGIPTLPGGPPPLGLPRGVAPLPPGMKDDDQNIIPEPVRKIGSGVAESADDVADSFLSPIGLVTLGLGALPKAVQKVAALLFAGQAVKQLPGAAKEFQDAVKSGDYQRAGKAGGDLVANISMAGLLAKLGLTPEAAGTPKVKPSNEPASPELDALAERARKILPKAAQAAIETPTTPPPEEVPNASGQPEAATKNGDLRAQPVESEGKVPVAQSSGGVQPPEEKAREVALTPSIKRATEILNTPALEPVKYEGGLTSEALKAGAALKDPTELARLQELEQAMKQKVDEAKSNVAKGAPDAMHTYAALAQRLQYFREMIEGATGGKGSETKLNIIKQLIPDYKQPFTAEGKPVEEVTPNAQEKEKKEGDVLTPAIQVGGKTFTGEDHLAAYEKAKVTSQPDTSGAQEGFVDAQGKFLTREQAAQQTGLPTAKESGKLHSSDLPEEPLPNAKVLGNGPVKEPYSDEHAISMHVASVDLSNFPKEKIIESLPPELRDKVSEVQRFKAGLVPTLMHSKVPSKLNIPSRVQITFKDKASAQKAYDYFKKATQPEALPKPALALPAGPGAATAAGATIQSDIGQRWSRTSHPSKSSPMRWLSSRNRRVPSARS